MFFITALKSIKVQLKPVKKNHLLKSIFFTGDFCKQGNSMTNLQWSWQPISLDSLTGVL